MKATRPEAIRAIAWCALLMLSADAWSCSCMPYPEDPAEAARKAWSQSDAIVSGKVVEQRPVAGGDAPEAIEVTIAVKRRWKGPKAATLRIRTPESSAACGYGFQTGRDYVVFAVRAADDEYTTHLCSLTRPLREASKYVSALDALAASK